MNRDTMLAQAGTLTEWAELWQREEAGATEEVSFLLKRAARLARLVAGDDPGPEPEVLPAAPELAEVREG